jgi:Ring finger domain
MDLRERNADENNTVSVPLRPNVHDSTARPHSKSPPHLSLVERSKSDQTTTTHTPAEPVLLAPAPRVVTEAVAAASCPSPRPAWLIREPTPPLSFPSVDCGYEDEKVVHMTTVRRSQSHHQFHKFETQTQNILESKEADPHRRVSHILDIDTCDYNDDGDFDDTDTPLWVLLDDDEAIIPDLFRSDSSRPSLSSTFTSPVSSPRRRPATSPAAVGSRRHPHSALRRTSSTSPRMSRTNSYADLYDITSNPWQRGWQRSDSPIPFHDPEISFADAAIPGAGFKQESPVATTATTTTTTTTTATATATLTSTTSKPRSKQPTQKNIDAADHNHTDELVEGDACAICLQDLSDNFVILNPCKHQYHASCAISWFKTRFSCPLCRQAPQFVLSKGMSDEVHELESIWYRHYMSDASSNPLNGADDVLQQGEYLLKPGEQLKLASHMANTMPISDLMGIISVLQVGDKPIASKSKSYPPLLLALRHHVSLLCVRSTIGTHERAYDDAAADTTDATRMIWSHSSRQWTPLAHVQPLWHTDFHHQHRHGRHHHRPEREQSPTPDASTGISSAATIPVTSATRSTSPVPIIEEPSLNAEEALVRYVNMQQQIAAIDSFCTMEEIQELSRFGALSPPPMRDLIPCATLVPDQRHTSAAKSRPQREQPQSSSLMRMLSPLQQFVRTSIRDAADNAQSEHESSHSDEATGLSLEAAAKAGLAAGLAASAVQYVSVVPSSVAMAIDPRNAHQFEKLPFGSTAVMKTAARMAHTSVFFSAYTLGKRVLDVRDASSSKFGNGDMLGSFIAGCAAGAAARAVVSLSSAPRTAPFQLGVQFAIFERVKSIATDIHGRSLNLTDVLTASVVAGTAAITANTVRTNLGSNFMNRFRPALAANMSRLPGTAMTAVVFEYASRCFAPDYVDHGDDDDAHEPVSFL